MDQKTLEDLVRKYPCALLPGDAAGITAITCPVRLQFVWLENARTDQNNPGKKPSYQCSGIIPAFADITPLTQIAMNCWQASKESKVRGTAKHKPLKEQKNNAGKYDGFGEQGFYFDAKTTNPVDVFGPDMVKIPVDRIKGGYWARLKLRAYSYDKNGNWGVGFGLQAVQLIAEDEVFSSAGPSSDGFEAVSAPAGNAPAAMPQSNGVSAVW